MSDREQIRDESIAPVGFEPKPSYVLKDDPNQVGVGIFESGISTLSTQEKLDIIDRDLSKFDQIEPSLKADLGGVHMSPMVAGPTQFLKNS